MRFSKQRPNYVPGNPLFDNGPLPVDRALIYITKGFGREASNESDHTVGTAVLEDYSRAEYYLERCPPQSAIIRYRALQKMFLVSGRY